MTTTSEDDAVEDFKNHLLVQGLLFNTIRARTGDVRLFLQWKALRQPGASLVTAAPAWISTHRAEWKPATTARRIQSLREWGRFMNYPLLEEFKTPPVGQGVAHPLPGGIPDVLKLYDAMPRAYLKAGIALMGLLGLRVAEAAEVRAHDFDRRGDEIKLTVVGKGYKARTIPVAPSVWCKIEAAWEDASQRPGDNRLVPIEITTLRNAVSRIGKRVLGYDVSSHDLRHTFASAYYRHCKDLRAVQTFLGHARSTTTEGYTAVSAETLAQAGDIL